MKQYVLLISITLMAAVLIAIGSSYSGYEVGYNKGYQAGLNYVPPVQARIDSLTIPEFTANERRIISQFMLIIKKASEVKE